jgi:hypothetical protein
MTQENESWDPVNKETYSELYYYYKAPDFYEAEGYFSDEY